MIKEININKPIWIIGDIHGDYQKLKELVEKIPEENPTLCFVGDLVDRGNENIKVINFVKENNHYCVKGNHEEIMIREDYRDIWLNSGGYETIKEYKDKPNLLKKHRAFLSKLPIVIKFNLKGEKPLYVSHSGFDIDNLNNIDLEDIMWNKYGKYKVSENGVNIFGHIITPIESAFLSKSHICIDSGGYKKYNKEKGIGLLTAIEYPSLKRVFVKN